jgi:hypothetical protein
MTLSGQWISNYSGNNSGTLVIDIDDVGDHHKGSACLWDNNQANPCSRVSFRTFSKAETHNLHIPVSPIDHWGNPIRPEIIQISSQTDFCFLEQQTSIFNSTIKL